jgi:hypothetical protein
MTILYQESVCALVPPEEELDRMVSTAVQTALELIYPGTAQRGRVHGNTPIHIVIVDPGKPPEVVGGEIFDFEKAIIFENHFGPPDDAPINISRSKAYLSWLYKKDTSELSKLMPHLILKGETKYEGGVHRYGIPIGVSGLKWWWDQQIGETVASMMKAHSIGKMKEIREDKKIKFLP